MSMMVKTKTISEGVMLTNADGGTNTGDVYGERRKPE